MIKHLPLIALLLSAVTYSQSYKVAVASYKANSEVVQDSVPQRTSEVLAFKTAEGYGRNTVGGRGGKVIHVTNLNDSGSGSLREAIETHGPRTVVFDVAGDIFLNSPLYLGSSNTAANIEEEYITIAGETAPSPGITLRDNGLEVYCKEVIVRHITIRPHNDYNNFDALRIRNWGNGYVLNNVIFDHLSISGGDDENVNFDGASSSNGVYDVTIQNCMIGKGTGKYNFLFGNYVYRTSILRNYMSHEQSRSVFFGYGRDNESAEMINNIMYANQGNTNVAWGNHVDVIGNVYKDTPTNQSKYRAISYEASTYNNPNASVTDGSIFVADNFQIGSPWTQASTGTALPLYQSTITTYGESERVMSDSFITSWETTVTDIENAVFPTVGNYLFRDALDNTLLADYQNNTGDESAPTIPVKTLVERPANYDTDGDGIADSWESNINGTVGVDDSNHDHDGDGYTNLEEFLHYLAGE